MYGTITAGDKQIEMAADAASLYYYRKVFQEDFLKLTQDGDDNTDLFQKMGFIMAMQAKHKDKPSELQKLTFETFLTWLSEFEPLDLILATQQIMDIYYQQAATTSKAKKKGE